MKRIRLSNRENIERGEIMTQEQLAVFNVGENLDQLMNLDPRGYGVCRILYEGARNYTKKPLAMSAAERLVQTLKANDFVYIFTGFVLLPHKKAEMDGMVGSMLLARALVKAFDVKPVIICPTDCINAVKNMSYVVGLHCYENLEEVKNYPISMGVVAFTKEILMAESQANEILSQGLPSAIISIECPGANTNGVYHNAVGMDVTELEAKSDVLFQKCKNIGILNIAIGDLGNEMGMGTISGYVNSYIPYAANGDCVCGCHGGIMAKTEADNIITATVSDWGCYAMIAAIAYLKHDIDIMHHGEMEREVMKMATRSGMVDMTGWLDPAIDGFGIQLNKLIVDLMRECIRYPLLLEKKCDLWFGKVIELGFYER